MPTPTLGAITVYGTYPPEPPSWGGGLGSGLWDGIGWSHFSTPRIVPAWYIAQILNQKEAYYFSHYSQESRYYHDPQTTRGMVEPLSLIHISGSRSRSACRSTTGCRRS